MDEQGIDFALPIPKCSKLAKHHHAKPYSQSSLKSASLKEWFESKDSLIIFLDVFGSRNATGGTHPYFFSYLSISFISLSSIVRCWSVIKNLHIRSLLQGRVIFHNVPDFPG